MEPAALAQDFWYVVYTKLRQEKIAEENLLRQDYRTALPLFKTSRHIRRRRWQEQLNPMFPRYVFVQTKHDQQALSPIRSTIGVSHLVRFGNEIATISDSNLTMIMALSQQQNQKMFSEITPLQPGTKVLVNEGALAGLEGLVSNIADERIGVLLTLLGRQQTLLLPPNALEVLG